MIKGLVINSVMILFGSAAWAESVAVEAGSAEPAETVVVVQEVDLAAAEKIFQKSCKACHGNKGQGASSYPKISDKEPDYIMDKLERYRAGEKFGPNSVLMIQSAKKLSDADIASLSVYVATAFD
jgi:cytochrome c553